MRSTPRVSATLVLAHSWYSETLVQITKKYDFDIVLHIAFFCANWLEKVLRILDDSSTDIFATY